MGQKIKGPAAPKKASSASQRRGSGDVERRIYQSIYEGVMSHRLAPGTRLPEAVLSKLFDVSRATVRKVLQALSHDHIVQLRPNQSAVVATPSPEETRAIFEARRVIEAAVVRLVAEHAGKADLEVLRAQLHEEHTAMHRFDQPAWSRLASGFHLKLGELSGNPVLANYLNELISRCSLIVALYEPPGNAACEHDEHARIVDSIEASDPDQAVALMQEHLETLEKNICLERSDEAYSLAKMLGLD